MKHTDELSVIYRSRPAAKAIVNGSAYYPYIRGTVFFYKVRNGVLVRALVTGLPLGTLPCQNPIFAFHVHSGSSCTGNDEDLFKNTMGHYNPYDCPHPYHAGDLPPLFGVKGRAFSTFLTDRFNIDEIIGKAVIIHSSPDDFTTQPSGNAGEKIACGIIHRIR